MTQKYIKTPIPEEISDKGGATIQFVERQTVPLETSVREAIDGLYVLGQEALVCANFFGLMKSASDGIRRDGHARQIGDHITIYPVVTGEIDLDRGWNPAVNGVRIVARLLNELELDITNWSFADVTPGKQSITLNTVSTLGVEKIAEVGKPVAINGSGLPKTDAIRVDWAVEGTDKSGTIPSEKVTSDDVRADIAADALAELASEEYDGKTIVFTVRGNFSSAKIAAKLKYVAPPVEPPTVTSGSFDTELVTGTEWSCDGTHLKGCRVHLVQKDEETEEVLHDKTLVESYVGDDTHFAITVMKADIPEFESGVIVELTFTNDAGEASAGVMLDKRE